MLGKNDLRGKLPFVERVANVEKIFLRGRRHRGEDLESAVRIFLEFLRGYESMDFNGPCVTVFGSSKFKENHPYYKMARELGRRLAEKGFVVMTGGGPGIMEAANRGAKEAGGYTVGCNILLPQEQKPNRYLDKFIEFDHFFVRKVMLVKYSSAFVVLPGGFGTLDEFFETITLIQTKKLDRFPIMAMGTPFWSKIRNFVQDSLIKEKTIDIEDLSLLKSTDSVEEAVSYILQRYRKETKRESKK
ncbi:MAG: TIGR00730 family Rossman fold protein [bacterium]